MESIAIIPIIVQPYIFAHTTYDTQYISIVDVISSYIVARAWTDTWHIYAILMDLKYMNYKSALQSDIWSCAATCE